MATTSDVYVSIRPTAEVTGIDPFALGRDRRQPMTGFYKTMMQWLKCFFTEQGSDISDVTYGTPIASMVGGVVSSEHDLRDAAVISVRTATDTVKAAQRRASVPQDELLSDVTLAGLSVTADSVDFYVTMTSGAGLTLDLAVPTRAPSFSV